MQKHIGYSFFVGILTNGFVHGQEKETLAELLGNSKGAQLLIIHAKCFIVYD
jgi:hypothetical protein